MLVTFRRSFARGLPRRRFSVLRIEVEVNARIVRQSSLDLSGHIVGEHLIAASLDCTQHLPNYVHRLDLWKRELTRHIGADRTNVHTHYLGALPAQSVPQPIRQSPRVGLGSALCSGGGNCYPTKDREKVDDGPTAVLRQDRSKCTTEQERSKVVGFRLRPCRFGGVRCKETSPKGNSSVVYEQADIGFTESKTRLLGAGTQVKEQITPHSGQRPRRYWIQS